eukprot:TRINITY_DN81189_c0_g1_i1.p1 TRINITY_DN81189_c0_g1~~TRINITY_DN81189_c0_g1_i1.p1  ORF type:complete len:239 (-),score=64.37 TRINITY_DN81189_c0_g1_i1:325-999(-)
MEKSQWTGMLAALLLIFSVCCDAVNLTEDNWDELTEEMPVFVRFCRPESEKCQELQPTWDQLVKKYKENPNILVGDVDCSGTGKSLCKTLGVNSVPAIKQGDPDNLIDYTGDYDWEDLSSVLLRATDALASYKKKKDDYGKLHDITERLKKNIFLKEPKPGQEDKNVWEDLLPVLKDAPPLEQAEHLDKLQQLYDKMKKKLKQKDEELKRPKAKRKQGEGLFDI